MSAGEVGVPASDEAGRAAVSGGIVVFVSRPLPELRTALRGIRETAPPEVAMAVVATGLGDQDATYLLRRHLRDRINVLKFVHEGDLGDHCGLAVACRLARGDYLARLDDTLKLVPGWFERAIEALEENPAIGCLSLVAPADYRPGRGRPRTVHIEPIVVERIDMRNFVARRDILERYVPSCDDGSQDVCSLQRRLRRGRRRLAFLPGLAGPLPAGVDDAAGFDAPLAESDRPPHEGATASLCQLVQAYHLGDDVLLTCLSCGGSELEVMAARIRFCERHQVAIGFWYEMRCPECGELHYKDDFQLSCPA